MSEVPLHRFEVQVQNLGLEYATLSIGTSLRFYGTCMPAVGRMDYRSDRVSIPCSLGDGRRRVVPCS